MSKQLKKADFEAHKNTIFKTLYPGQEFIELELIAVEEKKQEGIEHFMLIFKGPAGKVLNDNTHSFEHEKMGKLDIFISAYKSDDSGVYYDAQFSRLLDDKS